MLILSSDPGLTGALALIDTRSGRLLECSDIPVCANGIVTGSMKNWIDVKALSQMMREWAMRHDYLSEGVQAIIERPIPMPSLPAQTIASQFDTFGVLRAVLERRSDAPLIAVNPGRWKQLYGYGADKEGALRTVRALYPATNYFNRQKDHNRAEAVLIGHWYKALNA